MNYQPGQNFSVSFSTNAITGTPTNADSLPTGVLRRNGTNDGSVTVTVTNHAAGDYTASGTVPSGYAPGDTLELIISATVGGQSGLGPVGMGTVTPANFASLAIDGSGIASANAVEWAGQDTEFNAALLPVIGEVSGNVSGRILGNTSTAFVGPGVWAMDGSGNALATSSAVASLQTSVNNLNNLSALASLIGTPTMEVPASGSIAYPFTFLVKDSEGHLLDVDSNTVTLTAKNAAGTDRSANLSSVTHTGTGQYAYTYTVLSSAAEEGLTFSAAGTVATSARIAYLSSAVVAVDTATAIAAIQAQTTAAQQQANVQAGLTDQGFTTALATNLGTTNTTVAGIRSGSNTVTAGNLPTDYLSGAEQTQLAAAATAAAGTGNMNMTINVTDASTSVAIVGAKVTISGAQAATAITITGGNAVVALNAGTVTVSITAPGYQGYNPTIHTVSGSHWDGGGSGTLGLTLTAINIPTAPGDNQATGYLYTRDQTGAIVTGVVINFQMTMTPAGEKASAYNAVTRQVTSDGNGLVSMPFAQGASYKAWTVSGQAACFVVPNNGATFELPDVLGSYAAP